MREDAERWDARYADHPQPVPSRPDALTDELEVTLPTAGTVLDVACGAGGQSLWFAERGLLVTALDVSPTAVDVARSAASAAGLAERIEVVETDLDDGLPGDQRYDVIVCQRFRATHLYESFVERLVPGGLALVTVLSRTGAESPGPFHAPSGELSTVFTRDDCDVVHHREGDGQESIALRRR